MIKQECIGIPDMILLLMIFCFKKIKIKAEIVLSPGGAYFLYEASVVRRSHSVLLGIVPVKFFDFLMVDGGTKKNLGTKL